MVGAGRRPDGEGRWVVERKVECAEKGPGVDGDPRRSKMEDLYPAVPEEPRRWPAGEIQLRSVELRHELRRRAESIRSFR